MLRNHVTLIINGEVHKISGESAFMTLAHFLRYEKKKTGTKIVCAEGDCGSCTVVFARHQDVGSNPDAPVYQSLNSCIAMVFSLDGASIVTVEGLKKKNQLSEVQASMVRNFAAQCGFCTPGFVMSMTALFEKKKKISVQKIKNSLTGNLCRCTGYDSIIKAACDVDQAKFQATSDSYSQMVSPDEIEFPIFLQGSRGEFFAPRELHEAIEYKQKNPNCIIFAGSTDLGVKLNKGSPLPEKILSLQLLENFRSISRTNDFIEIGAGTTIAQLQNEFENCLPKAAEFLNIFASPQIKNVATVVGNVANASPIADSVPLLMALDTEVIVAGKKGQRSICLDQFYLGYKKVSMSQDEFIIGLKIPIPKPTSRLECFKVSQRRDLDISSVNACYLIQVENQIITKSRVVYGGVGPTVLRLQLVEQELVGKNVQKIPREKIELLITTSIKPFSDLRGSAEFRSLIASKLFIKFLQRSFDNEAR